MVLYREELKRVEKPFPAQLPCMKEVFCSTSRQRALEMAGPYLSGKYRDYALWGQDQAMPADESFDQSFEDLLEDRFVLGSPEECYQQLRPYWEEFGVDHLVIRTHWAGMPVDTALHSMEAISRELLPELRKV
jgi:alkanesulfonate monooxygenase SsuD/methylene tetrahydromethanopterin reductase-like flavin-dependent oxidoreductase (luciferase family)